MLALIVLAVALLTLLHTVATSVLSVSKISGWDFLLFAFVLLFVGAKLGAYINSKILD